MQTSWDALHEPILPVLGAMLANLDLPAGSCVLDLACGAGSKLDVVRQALGPITILALDLDRSALLAISPPSGVRLARIAANALALPLDAACLDGAICIAALGLFGDPALALAELRRALRPGAPLALITAEQRWAASHCWPAALVARVSAAYAASQAPWLHALAASEDVGGECAGRLAAQGFQNPHVRAFPLDSADPYAAEVQLLPWDRLRARVRTSLAPGDLARCDALCDPELSVRPLAFAALARA
jgi:ubiquinone/menaquinone biosynthesis C-methylase UbiE